MRKKLVLVALLLLFGMSTAANAQLNATANLTLNVTITPEITVTGGGTFTIDPTTGLSNMVTFNTSWTLPTSTTNVVFVSWFNSSNGALQAGSSKIPASALTANIGGTTAACGLPITNNGFTPTGGSFVANAMCQNFPFTGTIHARQVSPITTAVQLSLPGGTTAYGAGNYTGTYNVMVWAL